MKKSKWSFILSVVALVTVLSACGQNNNNAATSSANTSGTNAGEKVKLSFWNPWSDGGDESKVFLARVKEFQDANPNIILKAETIPGAQYKMKLKTQAAGRQLPDLMVVWPGAELTPYVDGNLLLPIDDIIGEWKDKLIPASQLKDYEVGGKQYAIPSNKVYSHLIFYNKEILKNVGYGAFPTTYEELKTLAAKLNEKKITPISLGDKGTWMLQSCYFSVIADRITGSRFLNQVLVTKDKKFTDPEFVKALGVIKEMNDLNFFNVDAANIDNTQASDQFFAGNSAMFIEGTWALNQNLSKIPTDFKLGFAVFPSIEGGSGDQTANSGITGHGIALNADLKGEKKEAAEKFLKFFFSDSLYQKLLSASSMVPATVEAPADLNPLFKEMVEVTNKITSITPVYDGTLSPDLTDIINNGLQGLLLKDGPTPEKIASDMQKAVK